MPVRVLSGSSLWHVRSIVAACGEAPETARGQFGELRHGRSCTARGIGKASGLSPPWSSPNGFRRLERQLEPHPPEQAPVTLSRTDDQFLCSLNCGRWQLGNPLPMNG